ncbi:GDSL-type esterase/lipase family protein [Bacillus taeanensis]|uniref:Spore gernimation protein n=1 Tax=Bacillus taeanensis TaxID=273032 RepID=A0A366XUP6_9BACI|nr:GDSL-type esterase/lipase family protein [Bacillus taeanensis]RBW67863.1 spore gernimation protein [Bacillus taeanensis]
MNWMNGNEKDVLRYTAIGDSLSVGVGASLFSPGFVERYLHLAENKLQKQIDVMKFAETGATTEDVLKSLDLPFVEEEIKNSEMITITAGGNDLIDVAEKFLETKDEQVLLQALTNCRKNMSSILKKIHQLKSQSADLYFIRLVNLYNPFPDRKEAVKWVRAFNKHLESFSRLKGVSVAKIDQAFQGNEERFLSFDGVHPNDFGYDKIAEVLNELGYAPLDLENMPEE